MKQVVMNKTQFIDILINVFGGTFTSVFGCLLRLTGTEEAYHRADWLMNQLYEDIDCEMDSEDSPIYNPDVPDHLGEPLHCVKIDGIINIKYYSQSRKLYKFSINEIQGSYIIYYPEDSFVKEKIEAAVK